MWEIPVANPSEVNSCVTYYTQTCDSTDVVARARNSMLGQIASEPAFNVLRTKEQLGYVTSAAATPTGMRVLVQSERDPVYVESRIESFLVTLKATIEEMTDEAFERHRQTQIEKREEKPKNLGEESRRYWGRISDKYYAFGQREREIEELRKVTKTEILDFFMKYVHPESPTRKKFSVHMRSQYKGTKFNPASAQLLIGAFTKNAIAVDVPALQTLMASNPDLSAVKEFAHEAITKASPAADVASELTALVDGLEPLAEVSDAKLRDGNVYVQDINAFKAGLTPNKAPYPVETFALSKL